MQSLLRPPLPAEACPLRGADDAARLVGHLRASLPGWKRAGVRVCAEGRREVWPLGLRAAICRAEWETRAGRQLLHLHVGADASCNALPAGFAR